MRGGRGVSFGMWLASVADPELKPSGSSGLLIGLNGPAHPQIYAL